MYQNFNNSIFGRRPKFLYIMGASGSGKTTLANFLDFSEPEKYKRLVQYTSREPRENEIDGYDYFFVSEKAYEQLDSEEMFFARVRREFAPSMYGTPLSAVDNEKINIVVASLEGLVDSINIYGPENVHILFIDQVLAPEADRGKGRYAKAEEKYCNILLDYLAYKEPKLKIARITHDKLKEIREDIKGLNEYFKGGFGQSFE